jgi:Mrp family chromosome partitioning ATPase
MSFEGNDMSTMKGNLENALDRARQSKQRGETDRRRDWQWAAAAQAARVGPIDLEFRHVDYDPEACAVNRVLIDETQLRQHGPAATAYRVLRTRILQRTRANGWSTLGITSPGPGDGKSVTSLNLALSIAREGNSNVFLIDLDMRNPKMCEYLGATPPTDINRYLEGQAHADDVLFSIGVENLTLAGTLTSTLDASELLGSGRVEALLEHIHSITPQPLILLDLPPILSTDDTLVVAPKIDACLLVLSEGGSRRDGAARALDLLAEFKLAGIVLNRSHDVTKDYYSKY